VLPTRFPRGRPVALLLAAAALVAAAPFYKDGPPLAHTGGFGEQTCRQCHSDAALNESGGTLEVSGLPAAYAPGRTYDLVVALRRAGMQRGGFELAVRYADGAAAGTQAGALQAVNARAEAAPDSANHVTYLRHTLAGTNVSGDSIRWLFRWTAPGEPRGPVVFHVAGNAANYDDSPLGDFIYATAVTVSSGRR
jgi:hypothetical protein